MTSTLNLSNSTVPAAPLEPKRYFFDVSPMKLLVMSTVTLGLYQIYWHYKNWKCVKERTDVIPILRAIFGVLFAYSLFLEIRETAKQAGRESTLAAGPLAILYFLLQLTWRLPDPFWVLGFLAVVPLVIAQREVVRIHRGLGLDPTINDRVSWLNILAIVIGGLWLLLIALSLIMDAAGLLPPA